LVRPVENRNHGQIEHAAGLARQSLPAPDRAPAVFGNQFLKRLVEVVGIFQRVGDVSFAQHCFPDLQSPVMRLLVHGVPSIALLVPLPSCVPKLRGQVTWPSYVAQTRWPQVGGPTCPARVFSPVYVAQATCSRRRRHAIVSCVFSPWG